MKEDYGFPLCIQLAVPEDLYGDREFIRVLELLREYGFYGVELNLTDFDHTDPAELTDFLQKFDLRLTMIATGVFANKQKLSLSHPDEVIRQETVRQLDKITAFAQKTHSGIICGFIKGGPTPDVTTAESQMHKSLKDITTRMPGRCDIYLEATNHYESSLINQVSQGAELSSAHGNTFKVLPDTYHMNIEEICMYTEIARYRNYYNNLHISDNNRCFPGLGGIDFLPILKVLKSFDYPGTISIEGKVRNTLEDDIKESCTYLKKLAKRL